MTKTTSYSECLPSPSFGSPVSHQSQSLSCLQDTYVWTSWQIRQTSAACQLLLSKTHISDFSSYQLQQFQGPGV